MLSGRSGVQQLKKKRVYLFLEDDLRKFRTESMCKVGIRVCYSTKVGQSRITMEMAILDSLESLPLEAATQIADLNYI